MKHLVQRLRLIVSMLAVVASPAAELRLSLPLGRTAYQGAERIAITVLRSGAGPLTEGEMVLKLSSEDGGSLTFRFLTQRVEPVQGVARAAEHLGVNGWALRPGAYTVEVTADGSSAHTNLTVHSPIRRSDFRLINWGRAKGRDQLAQGEENLGFNLFYGHYANDDEAHFIRAGVDFMGCCVMSGGHQMDLRPECDWSDPYVIRGGTRRVTRRAFIDRTRPNVPGVHFYDEPGLTWAKDPQTGEMTAHAVPWQRRSYEAAYGSSPSDWKQVDPANAEQAARWTHWARWKLGLMDAAWKDAQFGVSAVAPEFVGLTQSQYGYSAFSDGYYVNVVRSLPVTSGHGGYHDWGPGYFNPSMFLEFARAGDLTKPNWYLPTWYGSTTADQFRLEQYLSFQCGLQGMISPPDIEPGGTPEQSKAAQGVVESNHLLQRLGPVFNTLPATRPPVALLYSLSQFLHAQTLDRQVCYAHDTSHGRNVMFTYLAGKLLQHQFLPLLDEEVLDGTLTAHHRAVILTSIDYLDGNVVAALEDFARQGGLVLLTADSSVEVRGAVKLEVAPAWPDAGQIAELKRAGKSHEAGSLMRLRQALAAGRQLADAIRPQLDRVGIRPPLTSSEPGIVVTRHAAGDVEYLFAVNASHDPEGDPMLGLKAVTATLGLPDDGRPVYDAVHGESASNFQAVPEQRRLRGAYNFGPGQMRVFARTARPIGSVKVATPQLRRDFTATQAPLALGLNAVVLDDQGGLLCGSIPLRLVVTDPLCVTRFDLYRATDRGSLALSLPLALNDPPGQWKLTVTELLSSASGTRTFDPPAISTCSCAAGATWRAMHWPDDRGRVFRFFRLYPQVTLVTGTNEFDTVAAQRLTQILKPWNVTCRIVPADEASQPRTLTEDEARTWCGLEYAGSGQIKPGVSNPPVQVGFAVTGPVVLLGTPADNPLVKFVAEQRYLPFQPDGVALPGPRRGYVAWQREALGVHQESVTLIAYDADGMSEAVGTLYEMLAGLEPLTPLEPPRSSTITPATRRRPQPELHPAWTVVLPDRVAALSVVAGEIQALTDASIPNVVSPAGQVTSTKPLVASEYQALVQQWRTKDRSALIAARKAAPAGRLVKLAVSKGNRTAVAYWGGWVEILDASGAAKHRHCGPQDISALAWDGPRLLVGDADGRLSAFPSE